MSTQIAIRAIIIIIDCCCTGWKCIVLKQKFSNHPDLLLSPLFATMWGFHPFSKTRNARYVATNPLVALFDVVHWCSSLAILFTSFGGFRMVCPIHLHFLSCILRAIGFRASRKEFLIGDPVVRPPYAEDRSQTSIHEWLETLRSRARYHPSFAAV